MILRPERKIVVNGLPRTIKNRETRPLTAFGRKEKKNTIKNIRERERTRTTDAEGRIIRRRVKSKDMMKKNFLS
jgi:hypothetical protein